MSGPSPDGPPQMHIGGPPQMQHPQVQPQMRPPQIIRHTTPVHMPQGPSVVRMQRPQMVKSLQMTMDQSVGPFVGAQARMSNGGQISQQVHVISQNMLQPQQPTYMTGDGGHTMQVGMIDQQRPIVTSYGQQGNAQLSTMPIFQMGAPGQIRRRPGVQQPVYGTTLRVGVPGVHPPISTSATSIRFNTNNSNSGTSAMHLVTQPSQVQVSPAQRFIPTETHQQRMVVSDARATGPAMKIIPSSQQTLAPQSGGGQAALRPSMSAMVQPQCQQSNEHGGGTQTPHTPATTAATPPGAVGQATLDQQQHQQQNQHYLMVLEGAIQKVRMHHPDADMKNYYQLRTFLERDKISPQNAGRVEMWIRQLQQDPFYLLRKRTTHQQQHQGVVVGGAGAVSEETRQKLLAQKRVAQAQRLVPSALRTTIASTSSSLNSLLSQPVDPPVSATGPYPGQMTSQPAPALVAAAPSAPRHMQQQQQFHQQQQQQQVMMLPEQVPQSPVDPFKAAMEKLGREFSALEQQMGKARFARAVKQISEETRELRQSTGHVLPRDIFPTSPSETMGTEVKPESSKHDAEITIGCKRLAEDESAQGGIIGETTKLIHESKRLKVEDDDHPAKLDPSVSANSEDKLLLSGKAPMDEDLSLEDVSPRLRQELEFIMTKLEGVAISIAHPQQKSATCVQDYPGMDEMESHVTCRDMAEWNSSLHLKVIFHDKLMPCRVPPLFVRLPPDYLTLRRVNWLVRRSEFVVASQPQPEWSGEGHTFYTRDEVAAFLKAASTLVFQFLEGLRFRQQLNDPLTLSNVAEVWVKSILMAMTRFMTFGA